MKKLLLLAVMLLASCGNTHNTTYTDKDNYLIVSQNGESDYFEVKFLSSDYSDGSSIRARYIGTLEEIMGLDVLNVSGSLESNKFGGATLKSLEGKSWTFDAKAMTQWFEEGI